MIAKTIAQQIGNKALFMMGAKSLSDTGNGLTIRIPRSNGIQYIEIKLDAGKDLYNIRFYRITGTKFTVVSEEKEIFVNMLHSIISSHTGLDLQAPNVVNL
jgi:hypothetical protein